jgi:hypothetical protein
MAFITPASVADLANAEPEPEAPEPVAEAVTPGKPMLAVPFNLIPAQAVWWLWKGLIPFRHVTLFVAPGKTGKGTTLADVVARMTKGLAMPGDDPITLLGGAVAGPMNVIIVAPEDDANEALRPRFEAAGADMNMVYNLTKFSDGSQFYVPDNLPELSEAIGQIETETGIRVGLVIFDPLLAIVTRSVNTNAAARAVTNPLEDLAKQPLDYDPLDPDNDGAVHPGLAVVLTQHTTKAGKTASSQGLVDSVRMVVRIERLFPKQNDHPGRRLYVEATNLTDAVRSERFALVNATVMADGVPVEVSKVSWAAEAKPEQAQVKVGHRGYRTSGTPAPRHGAHRPATNPYPAKPQASDSQGSPSSSTPFRLIQRTGPDATLVPVGLYESMAAAMHAADELTGKNLGWKHREAAGYPVYMAQHEGSTFLAWDTREQAKAKG